VSVDNNVYNGKRWLNMLAKKIIEKNDLISVVMSPKKKILRI
jgi:hypothetical protein